MKRLVLFVFLCAASAMAQYNTAGQFSGVYRVQSFAGATFDAKLSACIAGMGAQGGICDARSMGSSTLAGNITVSVANVHILLPCATITTAYQFIVPAGVRNTRVEGCDYQGGSVASATTGGTVWVYTGSSAAFQVGDTTYAADTKGFRMENINLNTASAGSSAGGVAFYRTQEIDLRNNYLNGNSLTGQTGIYIDGTGSYSGGTFDSNVVDNFGTGAYLTGHISGSATDDYANGSAFLRLKVDCPTSGGSPIAGTYGVNIAGGDSDTFVGGDIEKCSTVFSQGAHAVNTVVMGMRNANPTLEALASTSGYFGLQVDTNGYITNTGAAPGSGGCTPGTTGSDCLQLSGGAVPANMTLGGTPSAGDNSSKLIDSAYANTVYNLIEASGSPLAMSAISGTYWQNTTSAYSFKLPTPASGLQFCFGNYQAQAQVISIIPPSGATIYFKGVAGTAGSSTGLVSGGAAGDFICVEATDSTTYMAIGSGFGLWVNH